MTTDEQGREANSGDLTGQRLTAVVFIHDYVQFNFEQAGVTAVVFPALRVGDRLLSRGELGYEGALVRLIGKQVAQVRVDRDRAWLLEFDAGEVLAIDLSPASGNWGPETVTVQHDDGTIDIW